MAGLNMRAKASLDVGGFKAGARALRTELNSLKSSFLGFTGALGASLGISGIVSKMKETAVGLNVARATLENVSKDMVEYQQNLQYVDDLSVKYKQDLIVLTDSFSRFHAAAMGTNFSLQEQKEMYQGLVQAATYFHMSSERTENMLIAVEQMMSKGKVTAEELRRQLGNNLPGAYAKMAQAAIETGYAGVKSFADFEKAMKAGKIGVDLLTTFVKNLNEETKNFNTDSLQLKMNELKNTFTEFVDSSNFEDFFTKVIDFADKSLKYLTDNFEGFLNNIKTLLLIIFVPKVIKGVGEMWKVFSGFFTKLSKGFARIALATRSWSALWANILKNIKALAGSGGLWGVAAVGVAKFASAFTNVQKQASKAADEVERLKNIKYNPSDPAEDRLQQAYANKKAAEADIKSATAYLNTPVKGTGGKLPAELVEQWTKLSKGGLVTGNGAQDRLISSEASANLRRYNAETQKLTLARHALSMAEIEILNITEERNKQLKAEGDILNENVESNAENKFEKAVQKYIDKQKELDNQLKAGAITLAKYNVETNDLVEKSWQSITAFDNFRAELAKLSPEMQKAGAHLEEAFGNLGLTKSIEAVTDASVDYFKELVTQNALLGKNYISQKDYDKALLKASETALEAMSAIKNLEVVLSYLDPITRQVVGSIIQQYNTLHQAEISKKQGEFAAEVGKIDKVPNLPARWAYKDTTSQFYTKMANGYEDIAEKYQKAIEEAKEDTEKLGDIKLEDLQKQFEDATQKAKTFKDMADISEWALEVKDLRKEWRQGLFGGVKSTADAMDRLSSGVKSFVETMNDADASTWEKILATLNEIIQTMDVLMSLTETYMTLKETHKNLQRAQSAEELKQLSTEYFINGQLAAQKQEEMALDAVAASQSKANAAASLSEQSALAGEAVAGATASGAKLAFPYNLIAIAAGVAAVVGALSSIKKYASGGIVKGSLNGDRNLVGVNGNEMILNGNQQGRLWNLINHGTANNSGGKVEFVISGQNLKGVLKNYETTRKG